MERLLEEQGGGGRRYVWNEGLKIFAENDAIQAAANFFGLIAGVLIIISGLKHFFNAARSVYRTSIRTTIVEAQLRSIRKALYSGRDIHRYVSELSRHAAQAAIYFTILSILPFGPFGAIPFAILVVWHLFQALVLARRVESIRSWLQARSNADYHGQPRPRLKKFLKLGIEG